MGNIIIKNRIRHSKNETFFDNINTKNASIAGLIASDGHIRQRKNSFEIILTLNQKDEPILKDIQKITSATYPVKRFSVIKSIFNQRMQKAFPLKEHFYSKLSFSSCKQWARTLYDYWNIPAGSKSLILEAPKQETTLDNKLAYICGLINGDGTIYTACNKNCSPHLRISLLGTENLLNWCKKTIEEYLKCPIRGQVMKERPDSKIYLLSIGGRNALTLYKKIISLDCVFLIRKWKNPKILTIINKN